MPKKINFLLFFVSISVLMLAQNQNDDFTGRWQAPKGDVIKVYKTKHGFVGKTVNEDALVLKDVKFSNGKWTATIINPREKIVARCELILESDKIKIIAKKGPFQKILYWIKV